MTPSNSRTHMRFARVHLDGESAVEHHHPGGRVSTHSIEDTRQKFHLQAGARKLCDWQIRQRCEAYGIITPFVPHQVRLVYEDDETPASHDAMVNMALNRSVRKIVSYGLSSYGYDIRLSRKFRVYRPAYRAVIDPHDFDEDRVLEECEGDHCDIPPNGYILANTLEHFHIPPDMVCDAIGKSTYARCFAGDVRVALANGTSIAFRDMAQRARRGERFWGYTIDDRGRLAVEELQDPRLTARDQELVRVSLDNDATIDVTPDHEFMLRDGSYKQAQDLHYNDSLMPLHRYVVRGYEMAYCPRMGMLRGTAGLADEYNLDYGHYPAGENEHRHHRDRNRLNNYPENIERMDAGEHIRMHNAEKFTDPDMLTLHGERITDGILRKMEDPAYLERWCENARAAARSFWDEVEHAGARRRWRRSQRESWTEERREQAAQRMRSGLARVARAHSSGNTRQDLTDDRVRRALQQGGSIVEAARLLNISRAPLFGRFRHVVEDLQARGDIKVNHRVVDVRRLRRRQDVYCLTVPNSHNFALEAGVFVHNCGLIVNLTPLEPAWRGHLTLELCNGTPVPIRVYANEGIAQIRFYEGPVADTTYASRAYGEGKYQDQPDRPIAARV